MTLPPHAGLALAARLAVFVLGLGIAACDPLTPDLDDPAPSGGGVSAPTLSVPGASAAEAQVIQAAVVRYPWLARLPNGPEIALRYARVILASEQRAVERARWKVLPRPEATIVSAEIERRHRARAPVERRLRALHEQMTRDAQPVVISTAHILVADFEARRTQYIIDAAAERAGRRAVFADLVGRRAVVVMQHDGLYDALPWSLGVTIGGSAVVTSEDGVDLNPFLNDSLAYVLDTHIKGVFWAAAMDVMREALYLDFDADPWLARRELQIMQDEGDARQLPPELTDEDEVRATILHRRQVAAEMRQSAASALLPLRIGAELFVPNGPVDLMLTALPQSRLGRAYQAGKDGMRAWRSKRMAKHLVDEVYQSLDTALDKKTRQFLRYAQSFRPEQLRALKQIHRHTGSERVVEALVVKQFRGDADVLWIAKMLDKKRIDPTFARRFTFDADMVQEFTLYSANPSWRALQDIIEGKAVSAGVRASLASKVSGLLGEWAAAAHLTRLGLRRHGAGGPFVTIQRAVGYGKNGSIDIVAEGPGSRYVFAEVKTWSMATWSDAAQRRKLYEQLERHDQGIEELLGRAWRRRSDMKGKVLMVKKAGYEMLDSGTTSDVEKKLKAMDWKLELVEMDGTTFGQFIDDLRR